MCWKKEANVRISFMIFFGVLDFLLVGLTMDCEPLSVYYQWFFELLKELLLRLLDGWPQGKEFTYSCFAILSLV